MSHLRGILCLGQIKEIEIGGDADQHTLDEIQSHQSVETPSLVLWIEKQGHRERRKPEREDKLGDPQDDGDGSNIVVKTESLREGEERVGGQSEMPESAR